jgi:hypothetical protein
VLARRTGPQKTILRAADIAPILADHLQIKTVPSAAHLNAMLKSELFLAQFLVLDSIVRQARYLDDFTILPAGYSDFGAGRRFLNLAEGTSVATDPTTINAFLDVMAFASDADRTNTVAAALTVMLRHQWPGEKPLTLVTATKSHAGKGTITDFVTGNIPKADILYEAIDWPIQSQFQRQLRATPDLGVLLVDNVRLDSAGGRSKVIRSAFLESFVTTPTITLASPSSTDPITTRNEFALILNTNDGCLSTDLLNRSLPIHLAPTGDIHDRRSPIGNPKLEFLPRNRGLIEAELHGMVARWREAGRPLDIGVSHPMTPWARTIGGILQVSGFKNFLANVGRLKTAADPIREAISILALARPGKALRPADWAQLAVEQGLARTLFSAGERDTEIGRERAIGVILSRYLGESFEAPDCRLRLNGGVRRWVAGSNGHVRYEFAIENGAT